jgi:hypothetical protein
VITSSGKKIRREKNIGGIVNLRATQVFFVGEDSWDECVNHPDLPDLGIAKDGWICVSKTFDEQSDNLCKVTTEFVKDDRITSDN